MGSLSLIKHLHSCTSVLVISIIIQTNFLDFKRYRGKKRVSVDFIKTLFVFVGAYKNICMHAVICAHTTCLLVQFCAQFPLFCPNRVKPSPD